MLTPTTDDPDPGRGNYITVPVLPFYPVHLIIMLSWRSFRNLGNHNFRGHLMDVYVPAILLRVYVYLLLVNDSSE